MKIVYCIPMLYNSGGMERVLTQKVNWLVAHADHQITIITTERTPEGMKDAYFALDKRVRVVGLGIDFDADYRKPLLRKYYCHTHRMMVYRRALVNYIRDNKIDLCISLGGKEIAFLHRLPCRTIAEMHFAKGQRSQLLMANHSGWFWSLVGHIRTWQLVQDVKPLERLIVLTEQDKADWEKAGCRNVVCIPNPCSLDGRELEKCPISTEKNAEVLAVGRLHEQKGFDMLLQAWQGVEQRYPEWTLRIVGEGERREALERQIAQLGLTHVELPGRASDMVEEYAKASVFVLSSRYEGMPLALIEAMWCGVACVAFDCPHGPAELLAEGRGWIVANGNVEQLGKQIEYVLMHPAERQEKAEKAKVYSRNEYSEAAIMPKWIEVIGE